MGKGGGGSGASQKYQPNRVGYFGGRGSSGSKYVRHLPGGKAGAKDFFENIIKNGAIVRTMKDGTSITYRATSRDGTSVVDINGGNTFKLQKIHFVK